MERSKSEMMDFVMANLNQVDNLDVRPLFQRVFNSNLSKAIGVYVDSHTNTVEVHNNFKYNVNYEWTIEQNVEKFEKMLKDRNMTKEDLKMYRNNASLLDSYYFRKTDKNENSYSMSADGNTNLVYALRYVRSGIIEDNWQENNAFVDSIGLRYSTTAYEYILGNISVKRFQNGRIDIKGMTPEQKKRLDYIFEVGKKASKFIPRN